MTEPDLRLDVSAFDAVSQPAALEVVRPLCASPVWMDAMVARRPFGTLEQAIATSDSVLAGLVWTQVEKAGATTRQELAAMVRERLRATLR